MWRWIGLAVLAGYGAGHADGAAGAILVLVIVGLAFRAASEALPQGDGLREYRQ